MKNRIRMEVQSYTFQNKLYRPTAFMYDAILPFLYLRSLQSGFPFLDFPRIHPSQLVEPDFLEFVELA